MFHRLDRLSVRTLALPAHTARLGSALRTGSAGFTLIELLVVVVVIGILIAIAVPSYLGLADGATNRTSEQQIRAAMPAVQSFYLDNGTYVGLGNTAKKSPPGIVSYDSGLAVKVGTGKGAPTASTYCLNATADPSLSAKGPSPISWFTKANCQGAALATAP